MLAQTETPMSSHDHGNCELCDQIERENAALRERLERAKKDAARYHYIANNFALVEGYGWVLELFLAGAPSLETLEQCIDAARAGGK
jgi:hypothetical protein